MNTLAPLAIFLAIVAAFCCTPKPVYDGPKLKVLRQIERFEQTNAYIEANKGNL